MIDYAYPAICAERAMKELHEAMLKHDYARAMKAGMDAMVEIRMTMNAINHMKDQQNALRKQTASV